MLTVIVKPFLFTLVFVVVVVVVVVLERFRRLDLAFIASRAELELAFAIGTFELAIAFAFESFSPSALSRLMFTVTSTDRPSLLSTTTALGSSDFSFPSLLASVDRFSL